MYLEYHNLLKKFKEAENNYYEALDKKAKLLYSVTPHGTEVKAIVNHINNTSPDSNFIYYTSEIEEVDRLINSTRNTRDMLEYELKKKEIEMRNGVDVYDRIYVFKWIDKRKPNQFNKLIGYSISRTYDFIAEMKEILYKNTKSEKIGKK